MNAVMPQGTVMLKKAVKDIIEKLPREGANAPVHGAIIIGLQVIQNDKTGQPEPRVAFWSQLKPEAAVLAMKELIEQIEEQLLPGEAPMNAGHVNGT